MGPIRNMNWTQWMRTFIFCELGRRLSIERTGALRSRLTFPGQLLLPDICQAYETSGVSAVADAVPAQVRSPENCPPFRNRSNQT